jgi:leader peptidase (prepilin peptidase)/N-methyltransferase
MFDLLNSLQTTIGLFKSSPNSFIFAVGLTSLLIGSFLNVVISRLPVTLKRDWRKECYEYLNISIPETEQALSLQKLNLLLPRSHCPKCKATLRAIDNIPILSYIFLRGKCHFCAQPISIQYPLIEALSAILCVLVACKFGVSWQTLAGCFFTYVLIVQSMIDLEHKMIPDEITIPVLWLGIILSVFTIFTDMKSAIFGAVVGYLTLFCVYWIFYLATKKEGMGFGDFKLLAMLGAFLGWQMLPFIIIFSSVFGSIVGIGLIIISTIKRDTRIPFGPFLAISGWIALMYGTELNSWYMHYMRLY